MQRLLAIRSARATGMSVSEYSEIRIVDGRLFGSQTAGSLTP